MKNLFLCFIALLLTACGTIDSGNVGVRKTFGTVDTDEVDVGFYTAIISSVDEYSAKENAILLENLTPKARDNLSLRDMDVVVFYRALPNTIADLSIKYAGQSVESEQGYLYPAYNLVHAVARNVVYDEVSRLESLIIHTKRDELAVRIREGLQKELDANDKGVFQVTRVVVRAIATDPAVEASIRDAVAAQKRLEAMTVQEDIARKQAAVDIARAEGIAKANNIIQQSLTREYLQHEANEVMAKFAEKGGATTVILPAGLNVAPLISIK